MYVGLQLARYPRADLPGQVVDKVGHHAPCQFLSPDCDDQTKRLHDRIDNT
jgi:hypothetical protein